MTNIQVDVGETTIRLDWSAPPSNGATITSYDVKILQNGQLEHEDSTMDTSVFVGRDDLQDIGDVIRTVDTEYVVEIVAINSVGSGEKGTTTFTISAESAAPPKCEFRILCMEFSVMKYPVGDMIAVT